MLDVLEPLQDDAGLIDRLRAMRERGIWLTDNENRCLWFCDKVVQNSRSAARNYAKITGPVSERNRQRREAQDAITIAHDNALRDDPYEMRRQEHRREMGYRVDEHHNVVAVTNGAVPPPPAPPREIVVDPGF